MLKNSVVHRILEFVTSKSVVLYVKTEYHIDISSKNWSFLSM